MFSARFILRHFDKAAVAAALAWFVSGALGALWKPPQLQDRELIEDRITRIERYAAEREPAPPKLEDWSAAIKDQLLARRVPATRPYPSWVFYRRPNLVFEFIEPPSAPEARHFPPIGAAAVAARGKVTVTWEAAKNNAFVLVEKYQVLRQAGAGEYIVVAELEGEATKFVDEAVAPRVDYRYKVRSRGRRNDLDPRSRALRVEALEADERTADSEPTAPVRIPREIIVQPLIWRAASPEDEIARGRERDLQGTVSYKVYVAVGEGSKPDWAWRRFEAIEGGLDTPARVGSEPGQQLRARGRPERFEFFTGGVLIECGAERRTIDGRKRVGAYMVIRYQDGSEETVTSFDEPPELAGLKDK